MLRKVIVSAEVWFACWNHALTTETEEIMQVQCTLFLVLVLLYIYRGLLIGSMVEEGTLHLTAMRVSRRITKQKDRYFFLLLAETLCKLSLIQIGLRLITKT